MNSIAFITDVRVVWPGSIFLLERHGTVIWLCLWRGADSESHHRAPTTDGIPPPDLLSIRLSRACSVIVLAEGRSVGRGSGGNCNACKLASAGCGRSLIATELQARLPTRPAGWDTRSQRLSFICRSVRQADARSSGRSVRPSVYPPASRQGPSARMSIGPWVCRWVRGDFIRRQMAPTK